MQSVYIVHNARFVMPLVAPYIYEDNIQTGITDAHCKCLMLLSAETLSKVYAVIKLEVDEYVLPLKTILYR